MTQADRYRERAAEFRAKAADENDAHLKAQWEALEHAYLRLAEQADRNSRADLVCEPRSLKLMDIEGEPA